VHHLQPQRATYRQFWEAAEFNFILNIRIVHLTLTSRIQNFKRNMKSVILLIAFALIITSCKKVESLLTFTISNTANFTIQSSAPISLPFELQTPDVTTNSSQEFGNHNTRADLVKNVILDQLKLTITSPSSKTFSFLKSIHIYISTDNTNEIELAYQDDIVSTDATLNLTTTKAKLDSYIKSNSYNLRTKVITKETLTQDVDVKMEMKFKVTADPK
jgi:hypothetical protein